MTTRVGTGLGGMRGVIAAAAMTLVAIVLPGAIDVAGAAAGDPEHVSFTLEGCRNDGGITLPDGDGNFICPDAAYTSGNLGKGWNELDLVPYRLTADAGANAPNSQTYTITVVLDREDAGAPGYDVLSAPVLNTALSDPGCAEPTVGPETVLTPGLGGIDESIYRTFTLTQTKGTTCVYDYYGRLALGSHEFPGSSLHANLANQNLGTSGIGARDVSIPVKEIQPQELRKDMSATQGSDHIWNIYKEATPATISFGDTCESGAVFSKPVSVTVRWERLAATPSGPITVITHVYAKNPASRVITVNVTDEIRSGTTVLNTASVSGVDVPANTELLVLTHQTTVPAGTTDLNDVATATYTDKVTGIAVPGNTTATASATVQQTGQTKNSTATITDVESITGSGLSFSVDSFSGASGSFGGGYVAGTETAGPVSWTSASQSGNGSVTFAKTVYVDGPAVTTGTLSDTADLNGSDGFTAQATASVAISSTATVDLTIRKIMSPALASPMTFTFHVLDSSSNEVASTTIDVPAGVTTVDKTVTGLAPGTYTVHEDAQGPYPAQDSGPVVIDLPSCAGTAELTNQAAPATARVQKVSLPAGGGNWDFTLSGPDVNGDPFTETKTAAAGAGYVVFATPLEFDGGTYTITETLKSGWDLTDVDGDFNGDSGRATTSTASRTCSFTLNLATGDSAGLFSCTFENTQRGAIVVKKATDPPGAAGSFTYTGDAAGTIGDGGSITVTDLVPGTYTSTEADPTPDFDLVSIVCDDAAGPTDSTGSVSTRTATFRLDPGETVTCTFTNRQRGTAKVVKTHDGLAPSGTDSFTFQLRQGASASAAGTILETKTANAANGGVITFATKLVPGTTYNLCEVVMPGWQNNFATQYTAFNPSGDNSVVCTDFTVAAGEEKVFSVDNHRPGGLARTIGFWKNWSSCTGGRQAPVLDQTLYAAGSISIGLLTLNGGTANQSPDCLKAVRLLSKSDVSTGAKMASDPAYNLAAQLLAAKLNVVAGAGTCGAATTAIADADALLTAIGFDGTGAYKSSMTPAQRSQANALASTLDAYNNNLLC